ncbi:MAG: hypothetical protein ACK6DC_19815 [Planctomycetota bacterium]
MKQPYTILAALSLFFCCGLAPALAQRPTAPRLFSNKTLLYMRIDDTRDLKERLSVTGMGKMAEDPQIKPILGTFYSTLIGSMQGVQDAIGLNIEELLSVPNGEFAIALVGTKTEPAFCVMLEAGEELPALQLLLDRALQAAEQAGRTPETKEVGKITLTTVSGRRSGENAGFFIDSGVFVACTKIDYLEQLALVWTGNGIDHKPLADNRDFTTIMRRCVGTEGERPQVSFFVDPLAMVREIGKSSNGSVVVLSALKTLGIDGIKGIGGSMIIAPNEFDSIIHGHLLLNPNRQGIMRVLRPKSGSTEPEPWVSDQVVSYTTINWDIAKTFKAVQEIVDTFGGEGTFENRVITQGNKTLGIDIRKDIVEVIDDRFTLVQTIVPPKKINSQSNVYSLHLKEASRVKTEILPKLYEKFKETGPGLKSKLVGDVNVYYAEIRAEAPENPRIRLPQPAWCVLGNELIASDSLKALEDLISFYSGGDGQLSDSIEFNLVRDRIKAQTKNADMSIMAYQRPEEGMRLMYDLATDPDNIDSLEQMSENNPFFQAIVTALRGKKLPPFEVIAKYLAPGGAFVIDEETGLHYTGFSMRRE